MRRRPTILAVLASLAAGAAVAAGLLLATEGDGGHKPTRSAYLTRVSTICRRYTRQLVRIATPTELAAFGDVISDVTQALPVLRHQAAAMRAVEPPDELRARIDHLFAVSNRSLLGLEAMLSAAKQRNAGGVANGLARFTEARDEAHSLATAIGVRCELH